MTMCGLVRLLGVATSLFLSKLALSAAVETGGCNIERIGEEPFGVAPVVVPIHSDFRMSGWVINPHQGSVPLDMAIRFTSRGRSVIFPVRHRVLRPDVVAHFKNKNLLIAGFTAIIPAMRLSSGTWKVLISYKAEDVDYACDNGLSLIIDGNGR